MSFHVPEKYRLKDAGLYSSDESFGNNGSFVLPASTLNKRHTLYVLASDGLGWEHVSVSTASRCPTWDEMCFVKNLFWDEDDCVMQLHPPKSQWVNNHAYCLHLWRPTKQNIPQPLEIMVGVKSLGLIMK